MNNKDKVNTSLKCLNTNMRRVFSCNKRDDLHMHIAEHKYDIVGLLETWANDTISDSISGYSLHRKDRNTKFKSKGEELLSILMIIWFHRRCSPLQLLIRCSY